MEWEVRGAFPRLEAACALVSGLLFVGVILYAIFIGPGEDLAAGASDTEIALHPRLPLQPNH